MSELSLYPEETHTIIKRRTRKLRLMYWFLNIIQKKTLMKFYPRNQTKLFISEAKKISQDLIPRIPYIGGKANYMTQFLELSALSIPLLKALKNHGVSTRKIGQILLLATESAYKLKKNPIRKIEQRRIFSNKQKEIWKCTAKYTQSSPYPFDYKLEYIKGDGKEFQFLIKYHECASVKLFRQEGIEELAPYLCQTDYIDWDMADIMVERTQTIANGGDFCDFKHIGRGSSGYRGRPPEDVPEWSNKFEE